MQKSSFCVAVGKDGKIVDMLFSKDSSGVEDDKITMQESLENANVQGEVVVIPIEDCVLDGATRGPVSTLQEATDTLCALDSLFNRGIVEDFITEIFKVGVRFGIEHAKKHSPS